MWIVLGEDKGKILLVSTNKTKAILPKGSFLTVETKENKHILRVTDSEQTEPYSPSPLLADMDLDSIRPDQKCQNIVHAYRVADLVERTDGLIDYIRPQSRARRSTQEEIDLALDLEAEGPKVFLATIQSGKNQVLCDDQGKAIKVALPPELFYHQILICGKTGSGKTVASKYLAQYFVEELKGYGAVLAVNVKDIDFLQMDKPSYTSNNKLLEEWNTLGQAPHGIDNFTVYYPANTVLDSSQGVNTNICKPITLNVKTIDPEALSGLLVGFSDIATQHLPNIFRHWRENRIERNQKFTFNDFINFFEKGIEDKYRYDTLNARRDPPGSVTLPAGTYGNILRNLHYAGEFFDNEGAENISANDVLVRGKMSVINVAGERGIQFGSIVLRHLLKEIIEEKRLNKSNIPLLIIIDEVHQFYDTTSSREALGVLDTICRTGRSKEIAVIFSSQNPTDIPKGLSNVINTKIFFKSDYATAKDFGISVSSDEMQSLGKGYGIANIHGLPQIKVLKFPLSLAGVFEKEKLS